MKIKIINLKVKNIVRELDFFGLSKKKLINVQIKVYPFNGVTMVFFCILFKFFFKFKLKLELHWYSVHFFSGN